MAGEWRSSTIGELCDTGVVELQTGPFWRWRRLEDSGQKMSTAIFGSVHWKGYRPSAQVVVSPCGWNCNAILERFYSMG